MGKINIAASRFNPRRVKTRGSGKKKELPLPSTRMGW